MLQWCRRVLQGVSAHSDITAGIRYNRLDTSHQMMAASRFTIRPDWSDHKWTALSPSIHTWHQMHLDMCLEWPLANIHVHHWIHCFYSKEKISSHIMFAELTSTPKYLTICLRQRFQKFIMWLLTLQVSEFSVFWRESGEFLHGSEISICL